MAVGVTDTPQHLKDAQLLALRQLLIQPVREFMQRNGGVRAPSRFRQQLCYGCGVQAKALLQQLSDRVELGRRFGEIRARQLDQQRGSRELERLALLQEPLRRGLAREDSLQVLDHSSAPVESSHSSTTLRSALSRP